MPSVRSQVKGSSFYMWISDIRYKIPYDKQMQTEEAKMQEEIWRSKRPNAGGRRSVARTKYTIHIFPKSGSWFFITTQIIFLFYVSIKNSFLLDISSESFEWEVVHSLRRLEYQRHLQYFFLGQALRKTWSEVEIIGCTMHNTTLWSRVSYSRFCNATGMRHILVISYNLVQHDSIFKRCLLSKIVVFCCLVIKQAKYLHQGGLNTKWLLTEHY